MDERTYTVDGMTCEHCVLSVSEEVAEVPGVDDVEVDLATGTLRIVGSADVTDEAVAAAVAEAGYALR